MKINRTRIILAFVGILILLSALSLSRYGWLEVTVPASIDPKAKVQVIVEREDGSRKTTDMKSGQTKKLFIRKGDVRVTGATKKQSSIDIVSIKMFATTRITTPSGEQRAVTKLGSNAKSCPLVLGGQLYSYNCTGEGKIYRHVALDPNHTSSTVPLFEDNPFFSLHPISGGLVGRVAEGDYEENSANFDISFVNPITEEVRTLSPEGAFHEAITHEQPEVVSADATKPYFAVIFRRTNEVFIFKDVNDPNPVKLKLDDGVEISDGDTVGIFSFVDGKLSVYVGPGDDPHDGSESGQYDPKEKNKARAFLYTYTLSGEKTSTVALPKDFRTSAVYPLTSSYFAAQQDGKLNMYYIAGGKNARKIYTMQDAGSPTLLNGQLYMQVAGSIYSFSPKDNGLFSLEGRFTSPGIKAAELFASPGGILFTGFSGRADNQPLDAYRLESTKQTVAPLEETLPYDNLADVITGYDYDDKLVTFYVRFNSTGEYDQIKAALQRVIMERGYNTGGRALELGPLN